MRLNATIRCVTLFFMLACVYGGFCATANLRSWKVANLSTRLPKDTQADMSDMLTSLQVNHCKMLNAPAYEPYSMLFDYNRVSAF